MAIVSKFSHASATVDLNDTTTGFSLSGQGWFPVVATPVYKGDPAPVVETLHLLLTDSSQDNIAADMQALHAMQVWAEAYINDPTVEDPVWLHAKMDNETGERRAVVHKIEVQYGASWYGDEATSIDIPVTVSVTRGPYWESTTARQLPQDNANTGMVTVYNYTASGSSTDPHDIVGDVGARVRLFEISATANRTDHYMGVRSENKHPTIANFVTTWELEDASLATDCVTASATASSGGGHIVVSESGQNWDDEWNTLGVLNLSDVCATGNYDDQRGTFLGLCRMYCTTGTWEVYAEYGNQADATAALNFWRRGQTVEISSNVWTVYEFDVYTLPINNQKALIDGDVDNDDVLANFGLYFWARRTAGAGNLLIDCWIPMPVDEGFVKLNSYASIGSTYFAMSPTGIVDGIFAGHLANINHDYFTLPPGDGRVHLVSLSSGSTHTLAEPTSVNVTDSGIYYERWLSLRGAE